tara:strand:- start:170 stop:1021 length:852 start_codon:yes stop_codon:yes gene_type:complete
MKIINQEQKEFWNEKKGEIWVSLESKIDKMLGPLGDQAIKILKPKVGEKILDIGCGTGSTSQTLSKLVGESGIITGIDISKPILNFAQKQKENKKIKNINFIQADAQNHQFSDLNFDAVFSRFGIMFFEDPISAFKNIKKSLSCNGRLTFVCWSKREDNDWINLSSNVARQFLELPPKANPKEPGPFAFEDYFYIEEILIKSGWKNIKIKEYKQNIVIGKTLDYAADFLSRMGPMSVPFENANEQTKEKVISALKECYSQYFTAKGVEFHFSSWIVSALNSQD